MIEAVKTRITIKRIHKEKTTASGIVLQNEDNPNPQAIVLSIGADVKIPIKAGDVVFVDWRYVVQLTHTGETVYVTDESNILAVDR
jgi:co-chaperonin GroES (HSP10)